MRRRSQLVRALASWSGFAWALVGSSLLGLGLATPGYAQEVLTISDGSNDLIQREAGQPDINQGTVLSAPFQVTAYTLTMSLGPSAFDGDTFGIVWRDSGTDVILGSTDAGTPAVAIDQLSFANGKDTIAFEILNHGVGATNIFALQAADGIPGDTVFASGGTTLFTCLSDPANPCGTDQITGLYMFGNSADLLYTLNGNALYHRLASDGTITQVADSSFFGAPSGMQGLSVVSSDFVLQNYDPPSVPTTPAVGTAILTLAMLTTGGHALLSRKHRLQ